MHQAESAGLSLAHPCKPRALGLRTHKKQKVRSASRINFPPFLRLTVTITIQFKKLLCDSAHIILMKLSNKLYNSIITDEKNNNGFLIYQCLSQWHKLKYNNNLGDFLDQVEVCLAAFDSIAYVQESSAIASIIVSKLSDDRPTLTNPLNENDTLMKDHILLINKLGDIVFDEKFKHKKAANKETLALASQIRPCNPHPCKDRKHNPKLTSHLIRRIGAGCFIPRNDALDILDLQLLNSALSLENPMLRNHHQRPSMSNQPFYLLHLTHASMLWKASFWWFSTQALHTICFNNINFFQDFIKFNIPISTGRNSNNLSRRAPP
ncbi:hypothetical protein VP01_3261g5 [Puccinia sorghi]|uniref:Uncharacterized protein n=1 Tax=Puccinia sorghi TaxID=27349 RepID=A0A0L6UXW8_9BASI|nr:hypothetical protein VP01_3261g5 [Puccinia sorghi]